MTKHKNSQIYTVIIIAAIVFSAYLLVFQTNIITNHNFPSSHYFSPPSELPKKVTYQVGSEIGSSGYTFTGFEGTGVTPNGNQEYAIFVAPAIPTFNAPLQNVQFNLGINQALILGSHSYQVVSYNVNEQTITLVEQAMTLNTNFSGRNNMKVN